MPDSDPVVFPARTRIHTGDQLMALSQTTTRRCTVPCRFVTVDGMTVPGKGGRPRKWKSDADRVRAYRARQQGEDEPPTIQQTIDDGGEVAALWTELQNLRETVAEQSPTISLLRSEVATLEGRLVDERDRFARLDEENERLRAALSRRPKRRTEPAGVETDHSRTTPNRAARRRSERERRRTSR